MPRKQNLSTEQKIVIGTIRAIVGMFKFVGRSFGVLFARSGKIKFGQRSAAKRGGLDKNEFSNRWAEIKDLLALGGASQAKQALIEADKLLDHALKLSGTSGNTMGERLIAAKDRFNPDSYQQVWQAHKLRNNLVHETKFDVLHHEIKSALAAFEKGLSDLGAL